MNGSRLVYSTGSSNECPSCRKPLHKCRCQAETSESPAGDGIVRISRETKARKGKTVTVISGLPLSDAELKPLAKRLKALCGTGGSVKPGIIEIQGDQRQSIKQFLEQLDYQVKLAGG